MKTIKFLFGVFTLIFASMSNAAIISYANYTHDTGTNIVVGDGLEWLQWDQTLDESINSIQTQLDLLEGGGWSIATNAQMSSLFNNFDFGGINWPDEENKDQTLITDLTVTTPLYDTPEYNFTRLFGNRFEIYGSSDIAGYTVLYGADNDHDGLHNTAQVRFYLGTIGECCTTDVKISKDSFDKYHHDSLTGIALVRSRSVPEPSIIALFAVGLFGIGLARRRQS